MQHATAVRKPVLVPVLYKTSVHSVPLPNTCRTYPGIIQQKWSELDTYLHQNNLKENIIQGNGFCFLNAVRKCMLHDFLQVLQFSQYSASNHSAFD